ncbi:putrescine importer [Mycolicibacterium madagascariense]|uniref:Putrescine importer n=2 Tax=Mycolicibacterium madagascariense TaxID=212765 RepID=A0A7I7XN27_9MYCO|nr:putrescine importer [Mycolicibacterium madagascariense]
MGAVIMSPASGLYFNFAPTSMAAGNVVPLIFLIAMLVTLPTALSYASMSRSLPSSGSAYTWMRRAVGPVWGVYTGWILNGFYLLAQVVLPGIGALYFNAILAQIGVPTGFLTWVVGVLLMAAIVVAVNYRGIDVSVKSTLIFMLVESIVVLALMITIFVVKGSAGQFGLSDAAHTFTPGAATGGTAAIFVALIFGIQGNVGFDAIAGMAEETHSPRKYIPIATIVGVVAVGTYWMVTGVGFVAALSPTEVADVVNGGGTTASAIAQRYWGGAGDLVISVIAFTSILAIFVSQNVASSRALYAMGRQGVAPRWLGVVDAKARVPRHAMTLGLVVTVVVTVLLGALLGTSNQYNWSATFASSLALLTYLAVNVSNIVFHLRHRRARFHVVMNGVVPVIGILVVGFVVEKSYLGSLWQSGWTYGGSVQVAVVVWLMLGGAWLLYLRLRHPEVLAADADVATAAENDEQRDVAFEPSDLPR